MENKIVVLCGKSGVGKDTIAQLLKDAGYNFIISVTSRPMKTEESDGNPYYFISDSEFKDLISDDSLVEYRTYKTKFGKWFYGVKKGSIDNENRYVVVLDLWGLSEFKKYFGDRVSSFLITVDDEERKNRALLRDKQDFNEEEWNRRAEDDFNIFNNSNALEDVDYIVENYDAAKCLNFITMKLLDLHVDEME